MGREYQEIVYFLQGKLNRFVSCKLRCASFVVSIVSYGQLTAVKKVICWPVSSDCIAGLSVQLTEVTCLFKLSPGQLLVLIDHRLRSIIKRPCNNIIINNLLTWSVQPLQGNLRPQPWCTDLSLSLSHGQYIKASVWDFLVMTSLYYVVKDVS